MSLGQKMTGWMWILYPVAVAVFMIVGINYVFSSGQEVLAQFSVKQEEIEAEKQRAEKLKNKVEILKAVDVDKAREDLEAMIEAVPPSKAIWLLINELNVMQAGSPLVVLSYKGVVGDVREATKSGEAATESAQTAEIKEMTLEVEMDTGGVADLAQGLAVLERLLPLVKIVSIEYSVNTAKVVVEGAWAAWPAPNFDPEQPLAINFGSVQRQRQLLGSLENVADKMELNAQEATPEATF